MLEVVNKRKCQLIKKKIQLQLSNRKSMCLLPIKVDQADIIKARAANMRRDLMTLTIVGEATTEELTTTEKTSEVVK